MPPYSNKDILKQLDKIGLFSGLDKITIKDLRADLEQKGYCDFYDLLTVSLLIYGFLTGKGGAFFNSDDPGSEIKEMLFAYKNNLTQNDIETLKLIAEGFTYDQIAEKLGTISIEGVKKRAQKIYSNLEVKNRFQAAYKAIKASLI